MVRLFVNAPKCTVSGTHGAAAAPVPARRAAGYCTSCTYASRAIRRCAWLQGRAWVVPLGWSLLPCVYSQVTKLFGGGVRRVLDLMHAGRPCTGMHMYVVGTHVGSMLAGRPPWIRWLLRVPPMPRPPRCGPTGRPPSPQAPRSYGPIASTWRHSKWPAPHTVGSGA